MDAVRWYFDLVFPVWFVSKRTENLQMVLETQFNARLNDAKIKRRKIKFSDKPYNNKILYLEAF